MNVALKVGYYATIVQREVGYRKRLSMADDFQAGDTVELKSGSPTMTIDNIGPQTYSGKTQGAWCDWFDKDVKPQHGWYPLTSLKKVKA